MTVLHTTHNFWPGFQIEIIRKFPAKAKKGGGTAAWHEISAIGSGDRNRNRNRNRISLRSEK